MSNQQQQQRHRRRRLPGVGTVVATALAVYGSYQLAAWAWSTWLAAPDDDDDEGDEPVVHDDSASQQKQQQQQQQNGNTRLHYNNRLLKIRMAQCCRQEIEITLAALTTTVLRRRIEESTDASAKALKEMRCRRRHRMQQELHDGQQEQHETTLWMKLQVETITRVMATAYAHTLIFVVLTVQVHLVSGHLYRRQLQQLHQKTQQHVTQDDAQHNADTTTTTTTAADDQDCRHQAMLSLLTCFDAFFWSTDGLEALLACVRQAVMVSAVTSDWRINEPACALHMTPDRFLAAVRQIRIAVERDNDNLLLQRFVLANNSNTDEKSTSKNNSLLLDEMYDLLESPVVADAVKDCLNCTFDLLQEQHWAPMFVRRGDDVPLAHVIAQVKNSANSFYSNDPSYAAAMEQLTSVTEAATVSFGE